MFQDSRFKIIDTHSHPQFPQFDQDRDSVVQRALDAGVRMICVGTDLEMSRKAIALAERYEGIWASVGLHPNDIDLETLNMNLESFEELAQNPKVVAIGEVGLDYYRTTELEKQNTQREAFAKFIELAVRNDKPLIIHCRDAHADMLSLLSSKFQVPRFKLRDSSSKLRGVIHSFTGTYDDAKRYIELGFCIGLNGIITFARNYDETVQNIPVDNIILETDAPYLTPVPYRGKRNEPANVVEVAKKVAELRSANYEEFCSKISQNTKRLFNI